VVSEKMKWVYICNDYVHNHCFPSILMFVLNLGVCGKGDFKVVI